MNRISASGSSGSPCLPLILHTNMQKTPSMRDKVSRDAESAGSLNVDFSMSNSSSCLSMFGLVLLLLLLYSPYGSGSHLCFCYLCISVGNIFIRENLIHVFNEV